MAYTIWPTSCFVHTRLHFVLYNWWMCKHGNRTFASRGKSGLRITTCTYKKDVTQFVLCWVYTFCNSNSIDAHHFWKRVSNIDSGACIIVKSVNLWCCAEMFRQSLFCEHNHWWIFNSRDWCHHFINGSHDIFDFFTNIHREVQLWKRALTVFPYHFFNWSILPKLTLIKW